MVKHVGKERAGGKEGLDFRDSRTPPRRTAAAAWVARSRVKRGSPRRLAALDELHAAGSANEQGAHAHRALPRDDAVPVADRRVEGSMVPSFQTREADGRARDLESSFTSFDTVIATSIARSVPNSVSEIEAVSFDSLSATASFELMMPGHAVRGRERKARSGSGALKVIHASESLPGELRSTLFRGLRSHYLF